MLLAIVLRRVEAFPLEYRLLLAQTLPMRPALAAFATAAAR